MTEILGGQTKAAQTKANPNPRDQGAAPKAAPGPAAFGKAAAARLPHSSPVKDYDDYYGKQKHVSEAQLNIDIGFLRGIKDWAGIESALAAYLKHHSKHAAPWMLGQLGTAMEINKRDPKAIKVAFGRYARLAMKSNDAVALIGACDRLLEHKYYEIEVPEGIGGAGKVRLNDLLDQAMTAAPQRPEPILMSLVAAEQRKDPKRMGDAAETLLSLGWPNFDGAWRIEIPKRMAALATTLKEDGRVAESQALLDRIPLVEARDLVIRLTWNGNAMLDLVVDESLGATVDHFNRRSVFGGALVKEGKSADREAVYVCPRAFNGEYSARVKVVYNDASKPAHVAVVEVITHEGTPDEKVKITKVSVAKPEPVKFTLTGARRTQVLPYEKPHTIKAPNPELEKPRDTSAQPNRKAAQPKVNATQSKGNATQPKTKVTQPKSSVPPAAATKPKK